MARHTKTILAVAWIPVAFVVGLWLGYARPWETATERAYRLCGECGQPAEIVDWLIDSNRHSTLTRAESIALWESTYTDGDKLKEAHELCMPCVEAVLDAAGLHGAP